MHPASPAPTVEPFDEQLVRELAAACEGTVLGPGEEAAAEASAFNVAVQHTPRLVVGAASAQDVEHAVRFATTVGAPVTVQATGHGIGWPCDGVLITTGRMNAVTVDPATRTARAEAGATWEQVIEAAAPHGLAPLNGSSVDVGVVGYIVGGGVGPLARTYGVAADLVRSFEVVTADGTSRQVDAVSDPDLFFALRGGKGNFAIVTAVTFELVELTEIYGGGLFYDAADAATVLHAYREWVQTLSRNTTTSIALINIPPFPEMPEPIRGKSVVHVRVAHVGDHAEGERIGAYLRGLAPVILDHLGVLPYAAIASIHQDPRDPMPAFDQGGMLRELAPETVDTLLAVNAGLPLVMVELRHLGGALDDAPAHPRAFDTHGAQFGLMTLGMLVPPIAEAVPGAAAAVHAAMAPWSVPTCMPNFIGGAPTGDRVREAFSEDTYAELVRIKQSVDPDDVFRCSHPLTDRG